MLAVANTALDLLVLELVLHGLGVGVLVLVLGVLAPVDAGLEDDVLADRRGVWGRALGVLCAEPELAPRFALRHARVDHLAVGDEADPPCGLDFLAIVVDLVLDDGGAAVLVGDLLRGRELEGCLVEVLVVGPVVSGFFWSDCQSPRLHDGVQEKIAKTGCSVRYG